MSVDKFNSILVENNKDGIFDRHIEFIARVWGWIGNLSATG